MKRVLPFLLAFLSRQAQTESCKRRGVRICGASIFFIAILNVMWLSMVLVESTFFECFFAGDGGKSHQSMHNIQQAQWDVEMEKWLNSSGDITQVPHTNQTYSFDSYYDLLIVIPAHATTDVQRRAAQRESWQMLLQNNGSCNSCRSARTVRVIYVVGNEGNEATVAEEASKFGDMVVLKWYSQSYYKDRARKTRLSIRAAVEKFEFGLLMKTDTDSFIFLDRLLPLLEERTMFWERPLTNESDGLRPGGLSIYAGAMTTDAVPITKEGHKWTDNIYKNVTRMPVYPLHAKGPGYFLSPDLARYIATLEEPVRIVGRKQKVASPRDLPSEDVSVGFWLFAKKYVPRWLPVCLKADGCRKSRDCIVDHYVDADEMRNRWERFSRTKNWCRA